MNLASIPSPSQGVWHLGPVPIRAYALCIILGVIVAVVMGERRWQARGGKKGTVTDVAALAVPFGLIGGRLYHVITSPENYFGPDGDPVKVLYIWEGGLGIYGAILLGGVGAWVACRRRGIPLPAFGDAVGPGIAIAQGIGRFGNYFNQELFGRPTDLPWGLEIDPGRDGSVPGEDTYHPTFLYEALWCFGVAVVVIWADRRFKLGRGRAFALYLALYAVGRAWIEALRADTANELFGVRVNLWTCLLVFLGAVLWIVTHSGPREQDVEPDAGSDEADSDPTDEDADSADSADSKAHRAARQPATAGHDDPSGGTDVRSTGDPVP